MLCRMNFTKNFRILSRTFFTTGWFPTTPVTTRTLRTFKSSFSTIGVDTILHANGDIKWWQNENVSVLECNINGTKLWYDGKLHRLDGPAIEYSDGTKEWYREGKHDRVDGPAV